MTARGTAVSGLLFHAGADEDGALAMARDAILLDAAVEHETSVLRTHGWIRPTITLGRTQAVPATLREAARRAGVDLVRRPTGGGWLLHLPGDLALTFVPAGPLGPGALRGAARDLAQAIAAGMAAGGVPALVFTAMAAPGAGREDVCFLRTDRDEVVAAPRDDDASARAPIKLAGVALARIGRAALVQSALPLVAAPDGLAPFVATWDPKRAPAVSASAGVDRAALCSLAARTLGARLGAAVRPWPGEFAAAASRRAAYALAEDAAPRGSGR